MSSVLKCLSIYLSIYEIYIAPLQGNYSEALLSVSRDCYSVLDLLYITANSF